jgi:hypothetical protein
MFDSYDDGHDTYDVETPADREHWRQEEYRRRRQEDKEYMSDEEFNDKYDRCPY